MNSGNFGSAMFSQALEQAATVLPVSPDADLGRSVYIAGPMAGLKDRNADAFNAEAKKWSDSGFVVANPANALSAGSRKELTDVLTGDLLALSRCTNVMMLEGWERSLGANIERDLAKYLGITIWHPYEYWQAYGLGWVNITLACGEHRVTLATVRTGPHPEFQSQNIITEWKDILS